MVYYYLVRSVCRRHELPGPPYMRFHVINNEPLETSYGSSRRRNVVVYISYVCGKSSHEYNNGTNFKRHRKLRSS